MKSSFTSLVGFFLLSIIILSCSKDVQNQSRQQAIAPQVISAAVPAGQTYVLSMSAGTTASIITQAQHYQLSQIATARDGSTSYKYIAQKGYTGADAVTLQQTTMSTSTAASGGCHTNHTGESTTTTTFSQTVVIKFDVAN